MSNSSNTSAPPRFTGAYYPLGYPQGLDKLEEPLAAIAWNLHEQGFFVIGYPGFLAMMIPVHDRHPRQVCMGLETGESGELLLSVGHKPDRPRIPLNDPDSLDQLAAALNKIGGKRQITKVRFWAQQGISLRSGDTLRH
jgi:hypothetical protein